MPWVLSRGEAYCNRCRRALAPDAQVYAGAHAPARWCAPCAEELGFDGKPALGRVEPVTGLDVSALATAAPDFVAAMQRLKEAAHQATKPRRCDVTLRIVGSE